VLSAEQARLFESLYREHFDFVFRNLRRAGVSAAAIDDAVQDVFMVVLRRLPDYRLGSSARSWLYAILAWIARNYRRQHLRNADLDELPEDRPGDDTGPFEHAARAADVRLLYRFLARLSEERRNVFILADLEQMTAPEIAGVLGMNLNTVYSRLRVIRGELGEFLAAGGTRGSR
jgi:RNA polymerase sigma-70 factor (ECF subfamily)